MADFELHESFQGTEASGHLQLDRYETVYQQLFSEALEDGVITEEERGRLKSAAEKLGLDPSRIDALENALRLAYETHHGQVVREVEGAPVVPDQADISGADAEVLYARIAYLEERVKELEEELDEARSQVAYEVDFSDIDAPVPSAALEEPAALHRRLRHDARDVATLHALFFAHMGNPDRQWCVAHALSFLGEANADEKRVHIEHSPQGLIMPKSALDGAAWRRLLFHPDDDALTSDILSLVVSAVLLAKSAALRQAGNSELLSSLDAKKRLDPATSTVQAARCFGWAAQTLGMAAPAIFATPQIEAVARMVPTVPPSLTLGKHALSGRSPNELAFIAGQQLAYYRPERFVRLLVPDIIDLQDLFLAALRIGNKALPLNAEVRRRVEPIAAGIEPLLDAGEIDRLRQAYQHFVEHGGVVNLQRWGTAADLTAARAGFTLSPSLEVAKQMLTLAGAPHVEQTIDDLIIFVTGDRYAKLREQIGIAVS